MSRANPISLFLLSFERKKKKEKRKKTEKKQTLNSKPYKKKNENSLDKILYAKNIGAKSVGLF